MKKWIRLFSEFTIKHISYLLSVPKPPDPFLREYIDLRQKTLQKQRILKMFSFAIRKASFFEEKTFLIICEGYVVENVHSFMKKLVLGCFLAL